MADRAVTPLLCLFQQPSTSNQGSMAKISGARAIDKDILRPVSAPGSSKRHLKGLLAESMSDWEEGPPSSQLPV